MNGPGKILVVDDEKLIRWSIAERLTRNGHEVEAAETGEQALEMIVARAPQLMLLDVRLPGIDGLTTLQRAMQLAPEMAVVMMSAHSTVDIAVEAMKQGACDFLIKPFTFQKMEEVVGKALGAALVREKVMRPAGPVAEDGSEIVARSAAMKQLLAMAQRVAASEASTALIEGESGVGKEVIARAIHAQSARAEKPFLQVNCAALPEQLLESELFGHERGSFTDAKVQKRGLFEAAEGGTVLLDEIGDLPAGGQAKLLRLLENKTFRRIGGLNELKADVRVVAATNVELQKRVQEERFRADLFFRLNVVRLTIPPLRERLEDLPALAAHFVSRFNREMNRSVKGVAGDALDALAKHSWPGNVRELRNVVERAFILHPTVTELKAQHLPAEILVSPVSAVPPAGSHGMELDATEKRLIGEAMAKSGGNQIRAAKLLGVSRDTLRYRLKKHGML